MLNAVLTELLRVRTLLILLGLLCLAILIWFVGPSVSVSGVTPLASAGWRMAAIAALFVTVAATLIVRIVLAGGPILWPSAIYWTPTVSPPWPAKNRPTRSN